MWVIFEGLDKSGKTTLEYAFLKKTNYEHIVIDRGPVGYMTFDKIFERTSNDRKENFIKQARKIMKSKDFVVIYCVANKKTVEERLKAHNESCPYDYDKAQKLYRDNIHRFYHDDMVAEIDTTYLSVERCVEVIIEKIKEVQRSEL